MKKNKGNVEVIIKEGTKIHAPMKEIQKRIEKESATFEYVNGVVFFNGNTDYDTNEIVTLVNSSMQSFHFRIGRDIEDNKKNHDGYNFSWYAKYLNEIKIVNDWIHFVQNNYWERDN